MNQPVDNVHNIEVTMLIDRCGLLVKLYLQHGPWDNILYTTDAQNILNKMDQ